MAQPPSLSFVDAPNSGPLPFYLTGTITPATDMSANMRTPWLAKTSHFFSARFQWPGGAGAVTAPTGTWSIEGTNTPTDATGSVIVTPASGQPAGSAGSLAADNVQSSLAFVALTYTASGGSGTGAVAVAVIGF